MTGSPLTIAVTVHCFFGWCRHAETALGARAAHDAMETHYRERHPAVIAAVIGQRAAAADRLADPGGAWAGHTLSCPSCRGSRPGCAAGRRFYAAAARVARAAPDAGRPGQDGAQEPADLFDDPSVLCTERELVFMRLAELEERLAELEGRVGELEEAAESAASSRRQGVLFDWPERPP